MKNAARIIISNLTEKDAVNLLTVIREEAIPVGIHPGNPRPKLELDRPEPPELLHKEYSGINWALESLDELVSECGDWGGATKRSEVERDIKALRTRLLRITEALKKCAVAADLLEAGYKKL